MVALRESSLHRMSRLSSMSSLPCPGWVPRSDGAGRNGASGGRSGRRRVGISIRMGIAGPTDSW